MERRRGDEEERSGEDWSGKDSRRDKRREEEKGRGRKHLDDDLFLLELQRRSERRDKG